MKSKPAATKSKENISFKEDIISTVIEASKPLLKVGTLLFI